ncbi:MAG TPA: hypothetical protein VN281_14645, partial [Verrucomicrobiae bacterium]|nr:hypothetical protein [Verrucomicrobiae bacterium]
MKPSTKKSFRLSQTTFRSSTATLQRRSMSSLPGSERARAPHPDGEGGYDPELLRKMDAWWRAANYLSVGQIYLLANPLLKKKLTRQDIKPRLLGHWGTTPGLNFIYVHLNRVIREQDLNV